MALVTGQLVLLSVVLPAFLLGIYRISSYLIDVRRRGRAVDKFPSHPKHWLWGHFHLFPGLNESGLKYCRDNASKYPRAYGEWMFNWVRPSVHVHHFETVKAILKTAEPKPESMKSISPWLGDGLLLSSGSKWSRNRRLLTPAFHFDILKGYIRVKNEATDIFLDKVLKSVNEGRNCEIFNNISLLTFDIILRCAFSYENDVQLKGEKHPYIQAIALLGQLWLKRQFQPWLFSDFIYYLTKDGKDFRRHCVYVQAVADEVIQKRRQTLQQQQTGIQMERYVDFLDILLTARNQDGSGLTDVEIRDEVDTFLFAGHDTTASSISWSLYSLAEHPDIQRKCQEEIDSILDDGNHVDDVFEWEDLSKLHYLTMCIKESLRLHSPVPFIGRQLENELTIDGITLPKRSLLDIDIYGLHHNPAVWEDSLEFRPDRFHPDNIAKKDAYSFVPFSAGPRNCIGQHFAMHEMKVMIARVLRRFFLKLDPDIKVKKTVNLIIKPENEMLLHATPRFM